MTYRLMGMAVGMVLASLAQAQEWIPFGEGHRFEALERQYQARSLIPWREVHADPSRYQGMVLTLQGTLRGRVSSSRRTLLIFQLEEGSTLQLTLEGGDLPAGVGATLRLLVRIEAGGAPSLLAATYDTGRGTTSSRLPEAKKEEPPLPEEEARKALSPDLGERLAQAIRPKVTQSTSEPSASPPPRSSSPSRGHIPLGGAFPSRDELAQVLQVVRSFNPRLPEDTARQISASLLRWSQAFGLRWQFLAALVAAESNFNPNATSPKGAMGLGQLMPGTAAGLGVSDAYDIDQNLYGAARYIRAQLDRYADRPPHEQFALALAAYNAGPGAVARHGGIPPYEETVNYIRRVAQYYIRLCRETGVPY